MEPAIAAGIVTGVAAVLVYLAGASDLLPTRQNRSRKRRLARERLRSGYNPLNAVLIRLATRRNQGQGTTREVERLWRIVAEVNHLFSPALRAALVGFLTHPKDDQLLATLDATFLEDYMQLMDHWKGLTGT